MSDSISSGASGPQLSEEQAQEYLAQLRAAPAAPLVQEVLVNLLNTAQVKLGRRDARLFIDLSAVVLEHCRQHLPAELTTQVDAALAQLRLGQVRAEGAATGQPAEPNDLAEAPPPSAEPVGAPPAGAGGPPPPATDSPSGSPTPGSPPSSPPPPPPGSGLWLPGRDF